MKQSLYVWKDTQIGSGSAFGGTLCVTATSVDEARLKIREFFLKTPGESGHEDMNRVVCSNGESANDWLNKDLAKEPEIAEVVISYGGDY